MLHYTHVPIIEAPRATLCQALDDLLERVARGVEVIVLRLERIELALNAAQFVQRLHVHAAAPRVAPATTATRPLSFCMGLPPVVVSVRRVPPALLTGGVLTSS